MPNVLVVGGTVSCVHQSDVVLTGTAKLTVGNAHVLLESDATIWALDGKCTQKGTGLTPCVKVVSVVGGKANKLTVGGKKVLLKTFTGTSNGKPDSTLTATAAGQAKLSAV